MALPLISQFLAIEFKEARDDGRVKRRQRSRHGTTGIAENVQQIGLQEDSESELLNRECLGVTPFDDHATPCWAPFMGVIGSLNRMLLCGNAAAPHCVGFPTWQDGSALCWVPNTMPNAGGVATNQASADKCAAAAFPATRSCPGWGAPAQTQDRNKTSECERGWCGPPSFISRCVAVPADGI